MNPQFQPPQSFAPSRASPAFSQQSGFQSVPLGPAKPPLNGPAQQQSGGPGAFPPQQPGAFQAPPPGRPLQGIPPNQLPPQGPPISKSQLPPAGPTQGFSAATPPLGQPPLNSGPPPGQGSQQGPPSHLPPQGPLTGKFPPSGAPRNQASPKPPESAPSGPPSSNLPTPPTGILPPISQKPLGQFSTNAPQNLPPQNAFSSSGPTKQLPPSTINSSQFEQSSHFSPPPPGQPASFNPPANQPPSFNAPPSNHPPSFNPPSTNQPSSFNPPGQVSSFNPPSGQSSSFNTPPTNPPSSFKSSPPNQSSPFNPPPSGQASSFNSPPSSQPPFNPPPTNQPPSFRTALPNQPYNPPPTNQQSSFNPPLPSKNFNAPLPTQTPSGPYNSNGPNSAPVNQFAGGQPPFSNSNFPPMGSIPPGKAFQTNHFGPPPSQFGQPPLPGQSQFAQQPVPGQPQFAGQPPPMGQLTGQMQGMNLSGPRQYPPRNAVDNGPHMPPPLSQQQQQQQQQGMVNGQQLRSPQSPGYPPAPGPYGPTGYQQTQQRRLDPDQMPSPIQVIQDDQQTRSGVFVTNQKGLVPPLVTTKYVVQDQGNASPRYIRSTMYNVPISQDLMKQTAVPFGLVISPMARVAEGEYPPPVVNFGELGPVRCIRCKAYMCPYMQFIDSGRRFHCLFCKAATEVPPEYFQHLDHTGQRMDRFERPELVLGTYELTATPDYCRNNTLPSPPALIFIIDVSYNNIKSGLVNLLCTQMKQIIQNLPRDQGQEKSKMKVGFITYNSSVHFYNIKGNLAAPQMLVVGDVQDMFMPLLDGFLCTPEESETVIDALMQQIPEMFGDTRETETVLLPAILAGLEALKASECVGKLLVFHSSLPTAEAPGKLRIRDERKLLGTDKEKTVLTPQTQAYNQLGQECVQFGCSVDLFIFNNSYIDIATISQVSRLTGGEVYKYTYFQADIDGDRLIKDVVNNISRPIAFDAVMRVRTSTGVRPTDFYGHCYMSNTTDVELASIDCDKALAVEIKHDDKLSEDEGIYIQVALLYTSCSGQRRLRIINLSLKTCSQMADLYRSCELDTLINFFSKQSVYRLLEHNPKAVKDGIINRAAQILANYRKNCASPSSAGQLILPECMKLLPLYVNCLLKSDALSGGSDMTIDDRAYVMQAVMTMDVPSSLVYFYPRLIPIHEITVEKETVEIPAQIRCTIEKMNEQGVYILENGIHMFMWIGLEANPDFIEQVFGVPSSVQVNTEVARLPELENPLNEAVRSVIDQIKAQHHHCMRLTLVRPREKLEPVFKHFLVEDRGVDGSSSYVDFLCHMHKEIRNLLS